MEQQRHPQKWGRAWEVDWFSLFGTILILTTTPLMVFYFYITCVHFEGALTAPIIQMIDGTLTPSSLLHRLPTINSTAFGIYFFWLTLQIVLFLLPDKLHRFFKGYSGGLHYGGCTPSGNSLPYQINGLQAWIVTHILLVLAVYLFDLFPLSIILNEWGALLWVANITGYAVAIFVFFKAHLFPSYPEDRRFTGNILYDFYMGIEQNPRIGRFDFKLFFNGRPGIVAWTMINLSFMAAQYSRYGAVTNSIILVNLLQALYVIDFFRFERWYLHTIDIEHEHFGWMLAWGDCVWLPWMYTLQGLYLVYHPVDLPVVAVIIVFTLGLSGYAIFRNANNQKKLFKRNGGKRKIWGKVPEAIDCAYTSADGTTHRGQLLCSGWWGIGRHMNYTGDLMLSLAFCLACGWDNLLPYFYFIYMIILLVHRCYRDEHRCHHKYGKGWEEYCKRVPYRILPGIF